METSRGHAVEKRHTPICPMYKYTNFVCSCVTKHPKFLPTKQCHLFVMHMVCVREKATLGATCVHGWQFSSYLTNLSITLPSL